MANFLAIPVKIGDNDRKFMEVKMMQAVSVLDRYIMVRYSFFRWRCSLTIAGKFVLAFAMASFTGILALIRIPLPFTPVPITGQVFGVLLSGVVCGAMFGTISQVIYVGLGVAVGIPWFAGGAAYSWNIFILPTGGYLLGFIIAPFLIGHYTDKGVSARRFLSQAELMMLGSGIILFCGAVNLSVLLDLGFRETIAKGVMPFIFVDMIKAIIAAVVSYSILPKSPYNGEM